MIIPTACLHVHAPVSIGKPVSCLPAERGVVWEEAIILLPDNVHYVFLSATIPNARQFAEWICHLHKQVGYVIHCIITSHELVSTSVDSASALNKMFTYYYVWLCHLHKQVCYVIHCIITSHEFVSTSILQVLYNVYLLLCLNLNVCQH